MDWAWGWSRTQIGHDEDTQNASLWSGSKNMGGLSVTRPDNGRRVHIRLGVWRNVWVSSPTLAWHVCRGQACLSTMPKSRFQGSRFVPTITLKSGVSVDHACVTSRPRRNYPTAGLWYDRNDLSIKLGGFRSDACEDWPFVCACDLSHIVAPRVTGVAVGGRDLNWERISLAEGRPGV